MKTDHISPSTVSRTSSSIINYVIIIGILLLELSLLIPYYLALFLLYMLDILLSLVSILLVALVFFFTDNCVILLKIPFTNYFNTFGGVVDHRICSHI